MHTIRQKGLLYIILFISFLLLLCPGRRAMAASDTTAYQQLIKKSEIQESRQTRKMATQFLKQYPRSAYIADVRLILAEHEENPAEAIRQYNAIITYYKYYKKGDYALYKICEIYYLQSRWSELEKDARRGLETFKNSSYRYQFLKYLIYTAIHKGDLERAHTYALDLLELDHHYENLAQSLLILSYILKKSTGYSRSYIYKLREIAMGYENSDIYPGVLFLLGDFYDRQGDHDKAFSAYSDILNKYPHAPEAELAFTRVERLKKYNPAIVAYIPDKNIIEKIDDLDISPERELTDETDGGDFFFTISIGPLYSYKQVKTFRAILKEYGTVQTVKSRKGFMLYVGQNATTEKAMVLKIRLAEEQGLNGRIVQVTRIKNKKYIYKE